jgi:hypothetical protein
MNLQRCLEIRVTYRWGKKSYIECKKRDSELIAGIGKRETLNEKWIKECAGYFQIIKMSNPCS